MRVKATTNIKYGGTWYSAGNVFEAAEADLAMLTGIAEPAEPAAPAQEPEEKPAPRKRTSRKK